MADRKSSHKEGTIASSSLKRSQRCLGSRSPIRTRSKSLASKRDLLNKSVSSGDLPFASTSLQTQDCVSDLSIKNKSNKRLSEEDVSPGKRAKKESSIDKELTAINLSVGKERSVPSSSVEIPKRKGRPRKKLWTTCDSSLLQTSSAQTSQSHSEASQRSDSNQAFAANIEDSFRGKRFKSNSRLLSNTRIGTSSSREPSGEQTIGLERASTTGSCASSSRRRSSRLNTKAPTNPSLSSSSGAAGTSSFGPNTTSNSGGGSSGRLGLLRSNTRSGGMDEDV
ncbi:unnamed protein product, partial [Medioppia subpectinata]